MDFLAYFLHIYKQCGETITVSEKKTDVKSFQEIGMAN